MMRLRRVICTFSAEDLSDTSNPRRDTLEPYWTPKSTSRESKPPNKFLNNMALMNNVLNCNPSSF